MKKTLINQEVNDVADWFRKGKPLNEVPPILGPNLNNVKLRKKTEQFSIYDEVNNYAALEKQGWCVQ